MQGSRIHWIDAVRSMAILMVVMCHSVEGIFGFDLEHMAEIGFASKLFAFAAFTFGRIGVPLFLFISGYLLLDRDWDRDSIRRFWKRNWLPLFLCVEAWIVLNSLFLWAIGGRFDPVKLICSMLFVDKIAMGHFWYMPMIVGFYLFLPIMGLALRRLDSKTIAFPITVVALYALGVPVLKQVFAVLGIQIGLTNQLDLGFSGGVYGVYLILGWCAKRKIFTRISTPLLSVACFLLFACCIAFQLWCYAGGVGYNIYYNNGVLLLCGLVLFELASRLPDSLFVGELDLQRGGCGESEKLTPLGRCCYSVAYYSFAIYLVHFPIRILLLPFFRQLPIIAPGKVLLLFFTVFVASFIICELVSKIPRLGKALLYLK